MKVNLGRTAKDDSVLVDQVDLAEGADRAQDLRRDAGRIVDCVESDPLAGVRAARGLIEVYVGFLATDH